MVRRKVTPECRHCGKPTRGTHPFLLALNGKQHRGHYHLACFIKVQRDVFTATRRWVKDDADEERLPEPDAQADPRRRCPICAEVFHLTHTTLDPRTGRNIRLYKCPQCGERDWEN